MKKIECLIADDEALARDVIKNYVSKLERLHLTATCTNGSEVYNFLKNNTVDLVFLDIKMPQLTGIELLKTIKNVPPVIITTAYREFALEGYEWNVIDYLLKPVSFPRFLKAIDKFDSWINPGGITNDPIQQVEVIEHSADHFIYVKADKKMIKVVLKDLLFIEGMKDYVKINTTNGSIITYQTIMYFEEKLSSNQFIRIHRSYIVSLQHINAFTASQIEIGEQVLPIGASYAKQVAQKLGADKKLKF